jgi:putative N-acetyltransferase (TIGR04045 family)
MATIASPSRAPSAAVCRIAAGRAELEAHFAVRRAIFVEAQGLFEGDDRDSHDARADTLHAVGVVEGAVCGAVRLYPLDREGLWKGDRLAVLPDARARHLGAALVRFAVATAGARGGHTMVAQIQLPNVRFFEHLGWSADGPAGAYHGVMHQPMAIALQAPARSLRPGR